MELLKVKIILLSVSISVLPLLAGNSSFLYKNVTLNEGEMPLKSALKLLSDQTGCIFSYNPAIVNEKIVVHLNKVKNLALSKVLTSILPSMVNYTTSGKYILLQSVKPKVEKQTIIPKAKSIIGKDPKKVSLVLPGIIPDNNTLPETVLTDTIVRILPGDKVLLTPLVPAIKNTTFGNIAIDSSDIKKIKARNFIRRTFELSAGISSSSPLSSILIEAGAYGIYGIISLSTDYNNSYRIGYGVGGKYEFRNNMGVNINIERNSLFAGKSYNLGVRAILTHLDPLVNFAVSRDFRLFLGPSVYMTQSSYESSSTDLGKSYGVGALIGVKIDLISLLTSKK